LDDDEVENLTEADIADLQLDTKIVLADAYTLLAGIPQNLESD
jgi:hypothetical protein